MVFSIVQLVMINTSFYCNLFWNDLLVSHSLLQLYYNIHYK
nr:MAG TPA: hypothetical protein [Caudoviricetes sp.]